MELHKAIKEIVASKGADMVCNLQIINYLLDYQAFKEKPATKLILRAIIDSGYAESILALSASPDGWQSKFKQYQHEFIDSCGYKEELAAYVFESLAYGIGLDIVEGVEPEIRPLFNVDSFFDIPEVEQPHQPASTPNNNLQKKDPADLYTIALSFYNEGKYQQAKGFIEKTISLTPSLSVPSKHLRLLGDIYRLLGLYEDAVKAYNECFSQKANEIQCSIDDLRENLKQHKVKDYENIMFCYFFCLYCAKRMSEAQWSHFVKGEARYGLMDAIKYCADKGINPIEDHIDIYFVDKSLLKKGDYLYADGTFSHELSDTKRVIARVVLTNTSDYEKAQGWNRGYIIPVSPICKNYKFKQYSSNFPTCAWSKFKADLPFPHSHYTKDDLNHWNEINKVESENFISISDYSLFPAFEVVDILNKNNPVPISDASDWFLPSIHHLKRISNLMNSFCDCIIWTSSQSDENNAIGYVLRYRTFLCLDKLSNISIMPIAAF